jgi:hypothetical protein
VARLKALAESARAWAGGRPGEAAGPAAPGAPAT